MRFRVSFVEKESLSRERSRFYNCAKRERGKKEEKKTKLDFLRTTKKKRYSFFFKDRTTEHRQQDDDDDWIDCFIRRLFIEKKNEKENFEKERKTKRKRKEKRTHTHTTTTMDKRRRKEDASRRGGEEEEDDDDDEEENDDDASGTRVEEFGFEREQKLSGRRRKAEKMREKSEIGRFRVHGTSGGDISRD